MGKLGEDSVKILLTLYRSIAGAPIGYISEHTGIDDPYRLLCTLENDGLVCRVSNGSFWTPAREPQYKLTSDGERLLKKAVLQS